MSKRFTLANVSLVVGIVGGLLAAIGVMRGWFVDPDPPADLRIVNIGVLDDQAGSGQSIDIQLRNAGGEVAFVSRVEFHISDYSQFALSGQVLSSGTYDVTLPTGPTVGGSTVSQAVSQEVRAGEVDRFTLTVGLEEGISGLHDYVATIQLLYNEGRTAVWSEPLEFRLSN